MKKIKLLTPILGLTATIGAITPLASCSCTKEGTTEGVVPTEGFNIKDVTLHGFKEDFEYKNYTKLIIPSNVKVIDTDAFNGLLSDSCKITTVVISSSVQTIKEGAFANCKNVAVYDFSSFTVDEINKLTVESGAFGADPYADGIYSYIKMNDSWTDIQKETLKNKLLAAGIPNYWLTEQSSGNVEVTNSMEQTAAGGSAQHEMKILGQYDYTFKYTAVVSRVDGTEGVTVEAGDVKIDETFKKITVNTNMTTYDQHTLADGDWVSYKIALFCSYEDEATNETVIKWVQNIETFKLTYEKIVIDSVVLSDTSATIPMGLTKKLTATVNPSTAKDRTVTWKTSDENIATVDQTGLVTSVAKGECKITATSNADPTKFAECAITIGDKAVVSIDVECETGVLHDNYTSKDIDVTATFSDGSYGSLDWSTGYTIKVKGTSSDIEAFDTNGYTLETAKTTFVVTSVSNPQVSKEITVGTDSALTEQGITYTEVKEGTTVVGYSAAWDKTTNLATQTIYIPSTYNGKPVVKIADNAFNYLYWDESTESHHRVVKASNISKVIIPNTVKEIGTQAFLLETNLESVVFNNSEANPSQLTKISESSFRYCTSITSMFIPKTVKSIEQSAFDCDEDEESQIVGVSSLEKVTIESNSQLELVKGSFITCKKLTTVVNNDNKDYLVCTNQSSPWDNTIIVNPSTATMAQKIAMLQYYTTLPASTNQTLNKIGAGTVYYETDKIFRLEKDVEYTFTINYKANSLSFTDNNVVFYLHDFNDAAAAITLGTCTIDGTTITPTLGSDNKVKFDKFDEKTDHTIVIKCTPKGICYNYNAIMGMESSVVTATLTFNSSERMYQLYSYSITAGTTYAFKIKIVDDGSGNPIQTNNIVMGNGAGWDDYFDLSTASCTRNDELFLIDTSYPDMGIQLINSAQEQIDDEIILKITCDVSCTGANFWAENK